MDSNVNLARRHTLDDNEKDAYLDAEKCLMDAPTSQNARLPMARTMFQALQEQHQLQSEHIHEVVSWLVSVIFVGIS
jgi:tyrosinase